jgi:hypothetical protein
MAGPSAASAVSVPSVWAAELPVWAALFPRVPVALFLPVAPAQPSPVQRAESLPSPSARDVSRRPTSTGRPAGRELLAPAEPATEAPVDLALAVPVTALGPLLAALGQQAVGPAADRPVAAIVAEAATGPVVARLERAAPGGCPVPEAAHRAESRGSQVSTAAHPAAPAAHPAAPAAHPAAPAAHPAVSVEHPAAPQRRPAVPAVPQLEPA